MPNQTTNRLNRSRSPVQRSKTMVATDYTKSADSAGKPAEKKSSFSGMFRREKTSSSGFGETGTVQQRVKSKSLKSKPKSKTDDTSSNSKRAQFVQARSNTSFNLFSNRRRSVQITDDIYNEAMRSAKSSVDLSVSSTDSITRSTNMNYIFLKIVLHTLPNVDKT